MEIETIERINSDFENRSEPFTAEMFPEEQLLEETKPENANERAMLLTAFCTLDYNRNATQLKDNLVTLYGWSPVFFDPDVFLDGYSEDYLSDVLDDLGFRYSNRDASGLWTNYELIRDNYGTVENMVRAADFDAPTLVEQLRDDGFLYLKGKKLAPFYTRVVSNNLVKLDNLWKLDIPVDTHIRRLSQDLFGQMSDDEIRATWRRVGQETEVSPHIIDGALWLIGNRWDEWGESYWEEVTN